MTRRAEDARDAQQRLRNDMMNAIPGWYSPLLHLAGTAGLCAVALVAAIALMDSVRAVELLTIPIMFVFLNIAEWWIHLYVMHRKPPLGFLYKTHVGEHHRLYRREDMRIRERRELIYTLIPLSGIIAIILVSVPLIVLPGAVFGANVAYLCLAMTSSYILFYELTHMAYHAPPDHWVTRSRTIRFLAEHHSRHHEVRLMHKWNFNITVPLADKLFRTTISDDLMAKIDAKRAD